MCLLGLVNILFVARDAAKKSPKGNWRPLVERNMPQVFFYGGTEGRVHCLIIIECCCVFPQPSNLHQTMDVLLRDTHTELKRYARP